MFRLQSLVAVVLSAAMAVPAFAQNQSFTLDSGQGLFYGLTKPYRPHPVAKVSFDDSTRIDKLIRAGVLYLSLRDAIALALENNLDLEVARYYPKLALSDLQRSSAGQLLRNVSSGLSSGPSSASLGVTASASQVGTTGSSSSSGNSGVLSGLSVQLAGSAIPNIDPTLFLSGTFAHTTNIETTTILTGTTALVTQYKSLIYGIQESYWTGTTVSVGLQSTLGLTQNTPTAIFNPVDQAYGQIQITQNLLNGFGMAVNKRAYHKARNNLRANDLSFQAQVIATVANVVNLYWDMVSFDDSLKVQKQTVELDRQFYDDTKRRAELGAIAPIDVIQSEADLKNAQQAEIAQEAQVLKQEMILKNVLTRSGLDSPAIVAARIVPTDHIDVPAQDPVVPLQDEIAEALHKRVEVEQNSITLENARLDLLGTKNNLLPSLQAVVTLTNNGQAGLVNAANPDPTLYGPVNGFLLGGYGTALGQVFNRNYPNYTVGVTLSIPLRNRSAQADMVTNELQYRQSEIQRRQLLNTIKLNVINAVTDQRNARAAYETSVVARKLQDETLSGTRRKYDLGTATILDVVVAQRDDTARQLTEIENLRQYQDANTNFKQMMGTILEAYDVSLDEAKTGQVGREPDLPVAPQQPQQK
ncbi:MAG: TolC family protein [Bryobacteraceae bacterium]|jgi:outer membrane protein TolC